MIKNLAKKLVPSKPKHTPASVSEMYKEWLIAKQQYVSARRIATQPLPYKKRVKHYTILKSATAKLEATAEVFDLAFATLTEVQKLEFVELVKELSE